MYSRLVCSFPTVLMLALFVAGDVFGFTAGTDPDLVGWWRLDDAAGMTAEDSSGYGNVGMIQGNPVWVTGPLAGALQFDGAETYISCGNRQSLQIQNKITLACWLRTPGFMRGWAAIITKGDNSWRLSRSGENGDSIHLGMNGTTTTGDPWFSANKLVTDNQWHHVAGVYDGSYGRIYIDGVQYASLAATGQLNANANNVLIGENEGAGNRFFNGTLDDVRIYKRGLTAEEIQIVMRGYTGPVADVVAPKNQATDVPRDTVLSWEANPVAQTHDVYFGTVFDDVNTASRSDPKGVLVSRDQTDATYDPTGLLAFGQTYYWRVDEVNYAPDLKIYRGLVWTFTTETYAYVVKPVKATASSSSTTSMGPEKTIDGSGLNPQDQHATTSSAMWLSKSTPAPAWIKYEFDGVYKIDQMWVWNSNQSMEPYMGYGARDVVIETSLDDIAWTGLNGVPEFARAPGKDGYAHNTTVDFGGILARYVRLTINKAWSGGAQAGLSEVRFHCIPLSAFGPEPANGATEVAPEAMLTWRPGREAVRHDVFFSKDAKAVADGTALIGSQTEHSYAPSMDIEQTYYWKVNEVNDAATTQTWEGSVWSFTTAPYIVIDDMESYTDRVNEQIFSYWLDGWGTTTNGSQVGYYDAPFCEWTIVHGGRQSMPLTFNNSSNMTAEATRTFDTAQDWTRSTVRTLTLYFYGQTNYVTSVPFWIQLTDQSGRTAKVVLGSAAGEDVGALANPAWTEWNIQLTRFTGISLTQIKSITLGIGPGGISGQMYIDDIHLTKL